MNRRPKPAFEDPALRTVMADAICIVCVDGLDRMGFIKSLECFIFVHMHRILWLKAWSAEFACVKSCYACFLGVERLFVK